MPRVLSMKSFVLVLGLSVVIGCAPRGEQVMIQNARGVSYTKGYSAGCQSGQHAAGRQNTIPKKDLNLYLSNQNYKTGWDEGYKECKFREKRVARLSSSYKHDTIDHIDQN